MNGIHDLGGMHGMGALDVELNEPVFHAEWERRMFAVMLACFAGGHFVVDEFRHAIERMDPAAYVSTSYYEHWLIVLERQLIESDLVSRDEIDARVAELAGGGA